MSTYSIEDYELKLANSFQELQVIDRSSLGLEQTYYLSTGYKVSVSSGDYVIVADTCDTCFAQEFDYSQDDTVTFNNDKMIGVTVVRIECRHTYTYDLVECPVYLKYQSSKLVVKSPSDTSGTAPCEGCRELTDIEGCA